MSNVEVKCNYITDEGEESKKQQRQRGFYQILAARALCIKTFLLRCFMRSMKYSLPSRLSSPGPTSSFYQQTRVSWLLGRMFLARVAHHHHLIILIIIIIIIILIIYSSYFIIIRIIMIVITKMQAVLSLKPTQKRPNQPC